MNMSKKTTNEMCTVFIYSLESFLPINDLHSNDFLIHGFCLCLGERALPVQLSRDSLGYKDNYSGMGLYCVPLSHKYNSKYFFILF